jgi:hypothetical protein
MATGVGFDLNVKNKNLEGSASVVINRNNSPNSGRRRRTRRPICRNPISIEAEPNCSEISFGNGSIKITEDSISGTYGDDLDIIQLSAEIRKRLTKEDKINQLEKFKADIIEKLKKPHTLEFRRKSVATVRQIESKIENIKDSNIKMDFDACVGNLVDAYRQMGGPLLKVISFDGGENKQINQTKNIDIRRVGIIEEFIRNARQFLPIDITRSLENSRNCKECNYDLDGMVADNNGVILCPNCNVENTISIGFVVDKSSETCENSDDYKDKINFENAFKAIQGLQNITITNETYDKLDIYFTNIRMDVGSLIRHRPLDERGRREGTSIQIMLDALKKTKLNNHYKNVHYICQQYWGWKLLNLSSIRETVMEEYDLSQKVFKQIKNERHSSLNVNFRLYRHLERVGIEVYPSDFKMIKTSEIVQYYNETWAKICKRLNWDIPRALPI